jgi:MFS family permease
MGKRVTATFKGLKLISRKNILSYHLALLRQFCGVTFIVVYSRQLMSTTGPNLADETPVIVNSVQLASGIIGIFLVSRLPRRRMIVYSTLSLAVINLAIGIVDIFQLAVPTLVSMTIFMVPCGALFNSVLWSYPSELATAARGKYASMMNWVGTAVVSMVPPYILKAMPNRSAYPIFFFFSAYLVFGAVVNRYVLISVETLEIERKEKKRRELLGQ